MAYSILASANNSYSFSGNVLTVKEARRAPSNPVFSSGVQAGLHTCPRCRGCKQFLLPLAHSNQTSRSPDFSSDSPFGFLKASSRTGGPDKRQGRRQSHLRTRALQDEGEAVERMRIKLEEQLSKSEAGDTEVVVVEGAGKSRQLLFDMELPFRLAQKS